MSEYEYHVATVADAVQIAEIESERFVYVYGSLPADQISLCSRRGFIEGEREDIADIIENSNNPQSLVATLQGRVKGYVLARDARIGLQQGIPWPTEALKWIATRAPAPTPLCQIVEIAAAAGIRGLGGPLVEKFLRQSEAAGIRHFIGHVLSAPVENGAAKKLLAAQGFENGIEQGLPAQTRSFWMKEPRTR
ncbi:MAG: hypothetical protein AB7G80_08330 [Dongiaceae bacterium]